MDEPDTDRIANDAKAFARKNKKRIAVRLTDPSEYPPEENPVSVFMAGSPGAGKTESSIALLDELGESVVRIDPDDLRTEFSEYSGDNSWLFQGAVSILVDKIQDLALKNCQSFILDGTLSNYARAEKNISRSLKRGRHVQYFAARSVVNELKSKFKPIISRLGVCAVGRSRDKLCSPVSEI